MILFFPQLTFKVLIDVVNDFLILALTTRIQQVHVVAETLLFAHIGVLRIDFAYGVRGGERRRESGTGIQLSRLP